MDPLVKKLFQQDLALARVPRRPRTLVPVVGFAAVIMTALILVVISRTTQSVSNPPVLLPQVATISPAPTPVPPPIAKFSGSSAVERTKPQPVAPNQPNQPVSNSPQTVPGKNTPGFRVIDPAGYARTLTDYRGHILIFGVWAPEQPETVVNLQKVYETFGTNTKLRILGVTSNPQPKPGDATFPTARNQGSTLLGAAPAQILIVDGTGTVRMRGSLLEEPDELINSIRTKLNQLGIIQ